MLIIRIKKAGAMFLNREDAARFRLSSGMYASSVGGDGAPAPAEEAFARVYIHIYLPEQSVKGRPPALPTARKAAGF
jgi:hypothetical protein